MDRDWLNMFDFAWPAFGLIDDVRPALASARSAGRTVALATLINAEGPSPRPIGAQMLIDPGARGIAGYVSGGCIEAAVARLAMCTLDNGQPQRLIFGRGSPYFDLPLSCGSRIEIWVERILAGDVATGVLLEGWRARQPMLWQVDLSGGARECHSLNADRTFLPQSGLHPGGRLFQMVWAPTPKLVITGGDPVALALADLGLQAGWEIILHRPRGPAFPPTRWQAVRYYTVDADAFFTTEPIDTWTAIVSTSHDIALDHAVLVHALRQPAFYVGVLGSRTKLAERRKRLVACDLGSAEFQRLHAPVGLQIGAKTPQEIAVAIWADLIRTLRHG